MRYVFSPMSIVYRTGSGRICPGCRRPIAQCACKTAARQALRADAGTVRVSRQTHSRAGKAVTVIEFTSLPTRDALEALASELKRCCASGGTVRDGAIEIQGEHRDRIVAELIRRGFAAKRAGG
jgi:translation initiation factor 1